MSYERMIGGYQLGDRLTGDGAELYAGRKGGRSFVLAIYDLREADREHLEREVQRTSALQHEAIVPCVEVVPSDDGWMLVFEQVDGLTLDKLIGESAEDRLPDAAAMHIAYSVFSALDAAHTARHDGKIKPLVHGRLGPEQVCVSWEGDVQLLGFGLSMLFRLSAGAAPEAWASPFDAPEVRSGGALTVRANTYSAATMIWSLLTGRKPPAAGAPEALWKLRPDLPSTLTQLFDQALAQPLLERRITAKEMAAALAAPAEGGRQELRWHVEAMKSIVNFDELLLMRDSLPPQIPTSSVPEIKIPPLVEVVPESDAFLDAVTLKPPPEDDRDGTALTIPAPPKNKP